MQWDTAKKEIKLKITTGLDVNTDRSQYCKIVDANHHCGTYGYEESGFKVKMGEKAHVEIPWSMLEECFIDLSAGLYNHETFKEKYPRQRRNRGCHVHIVGMIFVHSGLARKDGNNYYPT